MSYICKPIVPLSTTEKKQSSNALSLNAVHGIFVILISCVWITLSMGVYWCLSILWAGSNVTETVASLLILTSCLWAFFPRLDTPPPAALCINRTDFPALHGIVEQVAQTLGVPMPKLILTEQFTAGFGRFGWRHEPVLLLGHGLLSIANRHETIMLLAHELYHVHNSGWTHTRIVKITVGGLHNLLRLLSFQHIRRGNTIPRALRLPLAPLMLLMYLFKWCIAYEMRQIEDEADEAALTFSPNHAMESLLKKAALRHVPPVQNAYIAAQPAKKYDAIRAASDQVDPIRFSRLWQAVLRTQRDVFDKHPTVTQRISMAEQFGQQRVRTLLSMQSYSLAHQELKYWPVWLAQIEEQLNLVETTGELASAASL